MGAFWKRHVECPRGQQFYPLTLLSLFSSFCFLYKPNLTSSRQSIHKSLLIFYLDKKDKIYIRLLCLFWNFDFVSQKMEVSVIGNPQAKICRAELACRELGFRFGSGIISGESRNNKVSFLTHQSSKWKEIGLRCSPRSVKCEAIVSDHVPFLKPTRSVNASLFSFPSIAIALWAWIRLQNWVFLWFRRKRSLLLFHVGLLLHEILLQGQM